MDNNFEPHRGACSGLVRNLDSFKTFLEEIGARVMSLEKDGKGGFDAITCREANLDNCSRCVYRKECEAPITS